MKKKPKQMERNSKRKFILWICSGGLDIAAALWDTMNCFNCSIFNFQWHTTESIENCILLLVCCHQTCYDEEIKHFTI